MDRHRQRGPPRRRRTPLPLAPHNIPACFRTGTGIPGIRPISTTIPPRKLRERQPTDHCQPPWGPRKRGATNEHGPSVRHSPAHHKLRGRPAPPGTPLQVCPPGRCQNAHPPTSEKEGPASGGHHSPPRGHTNNPTSQHRTPQKARMAPCPTTSTRREGPPVYPGPGVLHGGGAPTAVKYQALHLLHPGHTLPHAR